MYTLWGRKRFLLPVTYFPTNLVYSTSNGYDNRVWREGAERDDRARQTVGGAGRRDTKVRWRAVSDEITVDRRTVDLLTSQSQGDTAVKVCREQDSNIETFGA